MTTHDGIAVVGGDGSLREVVSRIPEPEHSSSMAGGVIRAGSGNDVARQLQLNVADLAVQRIMMEQLYLLMWCALPAVRLWTVP